MRRPERRTRRWDLGERALSVADQSGRDAPGPGSSGEDAPGAAPAPMVPEGTHYGRYVGVLGVLALILITINTIVTKPNGATGIAPGHPAAPFAVPLVAGTLNGEADVATHANDGLAGRVPACAERSAEILNICQLYEKGPVVFALFVGAGSCPSVLGDMQKLAGEFPHVRFAAVSIRGDRAGLRRLVRSRGLTFPVGIDKDGALAVLYKVASCPQISFIDQGGVVQSQALLRRVPLATLRARVVALAAASAARASSATSSATSSAGAKQRSAG